MTRSQPAAEQETMIALNGKQVWVLGLGRSGRAACNLLVTKGARVTVLEAGDTPELRKAAQELAREDVKVQLGATDLPNAVPKLVVASTAFPRSHPWIKALEDKKVPVIGELELGYQHCRCLNIAVTGTNGKTTATGMIERILTLNQIKTRLAGSNGIPISSSAAESAQLDFIVLEANAFQLEHIRFFRPSVAVMLNIASDHMDRYASRTDYLRTKAHIFRNQQAFDWAIIQSEVLAQLQAMNLAIQSKVITFSAHNRRADLYLDRGMLMSRLPGWTGHLLDMENCRLRGPHNAENLMAALAVGHVMRVPLELMKDPLQTFTPPAHRCEMVAEIQGVTYVNDAKSTNVDALQKALLSLPSGERGEPNVWLIAGGREKGADYHDVGPMLSQRLKGAFLYGEARERLRSAWSLFTPCTLADSLLEALKKVARKATTGDVVLLSPACSSLDQFTNYQHRGEVFREAVRKMAAKKAGDSCSVET